MPKLTKQYAQQADEAAGEWKDSSAPLEPGWYLCRLLSVEAKEGKAAAYWSWKYEVVDGGRWVWDNTSLSEKAIGRLGKVFEAFEVPADTDTDELIGRLVNIELDLYTIPAGQRQGQMTNGVKSLAPGDTHPDFAQHAAPRQQKPSAGDFAGRRSPDPAYGSDEPF
jgi:hypothetical protein